MERMKNVQIPYELFIDLVLYHLNGEDDFDEEIRKGLERKLDAMLSRQLYSQYKTAPIEKSADFDDGMWVATLKQIRLRKG